MVAVPTIEIKLELGGETAAALDKLAKRLGMSPSATVYHALSVLNKAVFPPLVRAAEVPATKPASKPAPKPAPQASDVAEALEIAEEIQSLADEIPDPGVDFALSVTEKAADIAATIEQRDHVTDAQMEALENMLDGLKRWFHD